MNGSNSNTAGKNVATVETEQKRESDCISDALMQEIARRLKVTWENSTEGDIIGTTEPPADKTKIWWPRDATTGTRIGQPKVWDAPTEAWVALGNVTLPSQAKRRRKNGLQFVAAGAGPAVFTFESVGTDNYQIYLAPTRKVGGTWLAASANMTGFGWQVLAQTETSFTVHFFAVPTDGFGILWEIATLEEFSN